MTPNQLPTEGAIALDAINPVSQAAGTVITAYVPVQNFHSFRATIISGVLGASATLDAKLRQATSAAGAGVKDIPNKAVTQILKASGDNKIAYINARASDLDQANGFAFIVLSITVGTATSLVTGLLEGFYPRFEPPFDSAASPAINLGSANIVQIVP
jgi:hypothetical protein